MRSNEPDVKGIVGKLTQGAADAGFVYVTDVNAAGDELEAIELPAELEPDVTYGAGVVEGAEQPDEAQAFVDGLSDGPCADALAEAGFGPGAVVLFRVVRRCSRSRRRSRSSRCRSSPSSWTRARAT